jgi:hypothetical protein
VTASTANTSLSLLPQSSLLSAVVVDVVKTVSSPAPAPEQESSQCMSDVVNLPAAAPTAVLFDQHDVLEEESCMHVSADSSTDCWSDTRKKEAFEEALYRIRKRTYEREVNEAAFCITELFRQFFEPIKRQKREAVYQIVLVLMSAMRKLKIEFDEVHYLCC